MKLRINAKLRAALIAAITAVGFTLSQATASTVLDGQTYSGDVYTWSNVGTSQADMAYGGWKKTTQGDPGYIYGTEITKWDPTIKGLIANGGTTNFTKDLNTIRFAADTGSNTNMKYTFYPLSVGGIIAENAGYTITADGGNRVVYIGNATATAARSDIKGNFTINTSVATSDGTMTFMGTQTWNVGSGATFTLNSGKYAKTVDGSLSITGDGTVNLTGVTVIKKGSAIDVASGSSLTLNGTVNVMVDATDVVAPAAGTNGFGSAVADVPITGDGSLNTDGVTAWQINGGAATFNKDARTVSGETAVYFFQNADTADITAAAGATAVIVNTNNTTTPVSIGGDAHNWTELTINSGVVTTSHSNGSGCVSGDININAGGIFRVIGAHDAFGYSGAQTDNIIMKGSEGNTARLELNQNNDNSATMQTNIQMNGYSVITSTKAGGASRGFNTFGGNISAENKGNKIDRIEIRKDVTVTVAADGELDIAQMVLSGTSDGTRVLTKAGEGKLTFSGAAAMNALNLNAGSVEFNGATTINGNLTMVANTTVINTAALTFSNGGTIKIAQGGFSNSGTVNFSNTNVFDLSLLTDTEGVYTLFSGTSDVDLSKYNFTASNITGIDTTGKTWTFGTNGTISYTLATQKIWTGEVGDWDYESANWNGDELFTSDSVAVFNGEAMVTVKGDVEAEAIDLQNGAWVMLGGDTVAPASLTAGSLDLASGSDLMSFIAIDGLERFTVAEGAAWTIGEAQELGAGTNSGTITVSEDATARLTNASNAADLLLGIVGAGNISLGQNVTIASGEETSMPATKATGTLIIEEGVKLQVGNNKDKYASIASFTGVEMKQGAGIDTQARLVEINNLEVTTDDSHTNTIKLLDTYDSAAEIVGLDLKGTTALNGNLKITGDWKYKVNIEKLTGAYSEQDGYSGKLTLTGDKQTHNAVIGEMNIDTLTVENMNLVQLKGVTSLKTLSVKTGDMEIVSAASVSSLLDLSVAGASNATLTVKNGGVLTVGPDAALWGRSASSILLEEGSIMNLAGMQLVGGIDEGAAVGTESDNAQYGVDSSDWYIYNADITATKAITVGNELSLSSINTGEYAVELTNSDNMLSSVTVGEGGRFSMTGGELLSVIDNAGEVTLTSISLNDEIFVEEGGEEGAHYGLDGKATEGANYYLGTTDKYVTVVDGGTSATGSDITWGTTTGLTMTDGKIVTQAGEVAYETFYVNADSVDVSTITNPDTKGVEVAGGTLNVDRETALTITVTGEGTITGDKADAKQVGIAADATAYYTGAVEDSGVKFTPGDEISAVIISNNGEAAKAYSTTDKDLSVAAQKLEMTKQDGDVTVSNAIVVDELVNTTGKVLTLDNAEALLLVDMNITGSTVELSYINGDQQVAEGIVSLAGILQGGDATLKADLTLYGGSTLDVDGGDTHALTLGSTLTVDYASNLINLDDATLSALNAMNIGDTLKLIVAADQTTLGYGGDGYDGMWYDQMFNRAGTQGVSLQGDFTVYAQGDAFGLTKVSNVPEPTTGTLSLLALMALAARRRRK